MRTSWHCAYEVCPDPEIVSEDRASKPCSIGVVVPGWDVLEPGAFFEVSDRQFHNGMVAVESISLDC